MEREYKPSANAAGSLIIAVFVIFLLLFTGAVIYLPIAAVLIFSVFIFCIIYIPLSLKKMRICINDIDVIFRSGIIIASEKHMRISRLELAYTIRTPFSKYTGLNFVVLCVYGKSLVLPFLSISDSEEITDIMKKRTA